MATLTLLSNQSIKHHDDDVMKWLMKWGSGMVERKDQCGGPAAGSRPIYSRHEWKEEGLEFGGTSTPRYVFSSVVTAPHIKIPVPRHHIGICN